MGASAMDALLLADFLRYSLSGFCGLGGGWLEIVWSGPIGLGLAQSILAGLVGFVLSAAIVG